MFFKRKNEYKPLIPPEDFDDSTIEYTIYKKGKKKIAHYKPGYFSEQYLESLHFGLFNTNVYLPDVDVHIFEEIKNDNINNLFKNYKKQSEVIIKKLPNATEANFAFLGAGLKSINIQNGEPNKIKSLKGAFQEYGNDISFKYFNTEQVTTLEKAFLGIHNTDITIDFSDFKSKSLVNIKEGLMFSRPKSINFSGLIFNKNIHQKDIFFQSFTHHKDYLAFSEKHQDHLTKITITHKELKSLSLENLKYLEPFIDEKSYKDYEMIKHLRSI